jgi:hypothetical protein
MVALLSVVVGLWIVIRILRLHADSGEWQYLIATGAIGQTPAFRISFFVHLATATPVVLLGWIQFIPALRRRWPQAHPWVGRIYVGLVLLAAAPSGLGLAFGAAGGWVAAVAFFIVCPLWWWVTWRAWRRILRRDIAGHERMMIRSYALSFGAVSLRLWMFVMGGLLEWQTQWAYATCVWLAWGVNLLVAEAYIAVRHRNS